MGRSSDSFGPEWLATRIAALLPGYPDVSLCVALSGGVDSTALLAALAAGVSKPTRLRALHVDHGLRPASKQWAKHCRSLARRLHVSLRVLTTKVECPRGQSLEATAREARYRLLASALTPDEILLTAHHSDDQLETVLLQLFRGSGLPGIAGMPVLAPFANGWLARPLLSRSRTELEAWVRAQNLTWIDDDSNVDESLDRNFLRLRVLPLIRERWPGSQTAVARSARHAAEAQTLLDLLARADVDRASYGESLSVKSLRALPPDRRRNALRFWITRAGYRAPDTRRLEEIAGPLLDARADANPFVEWRSGERSSPNTTDGDAAATASDGVSDHASLRARDERTSARVQRDGDMLTLSSPPTSRARVVPQSSPLSAPSLSSPPSPPTSRNRAMPQGSTSPEESSSQRPSPTASSPRVPQRLASAPTDIIWTWRDSRTCVLPHDLGKLELDPDDRGPIDLDTLPDALLIRWRGGGERLSPRKGGPRRSLKNLLQEAHVPVAERARLPLLFSAASDGGVQLLAVADLLIDASVQATSATRRRARLLWTGAQRR